MWIRPLFTIIPFTSIHFHQIGKFGIIFDMRLCEIDDLAVSSRQLPRKFPTLKQFPPCVIPLSPDSYEHNITLMVIVMLHGPQALRTFSYTMFHHLIDPPPTLIDASYDT